MPKKMRLGTWVLKFKKKKKTCYVGWTSCSQCQGSTNSPQAYKGKKQNAEGSNTPLYLDHEHQLFRHHHAKHCMVTLNFMTELFVESKALPSMSPSTPFDAIWSFSKVFLLFFKIVSVVLNVYVFNLSNSELGEWFGCVADVDVMFLGALCYNVIAFCNTDFLNVRSQSMNDLQTDIKTNRTSTTWRNHDVLILPTRVLSPFRS